MGPSCRTETGRWGAQSHGRPTRRTEVVLGWPRFGGSAMAISVRELPTGGSVGDGGGPGQPTPGRWGWRCQRDGQRCCGCGGVPTGRSGNGAGATSVRAARSLRGRGGPQRQGLARAAARFMAKHDAGAAPPPPPWPRPGCCSVGAWRQLGTPHTTPTGTGICHA